MSRCYQAAPGVELVALDNGAVLFRSDTVSCRLEGTSASLVAGELWPRLASWRALDDLAAALPDYAAASIAGMLDELAGAGLVHARSGPPPAPAATSPAGLALAALGVDPADAAERLAALRLGVFGLGRVGALLAEGLAQAGVGGLLLADPGIEDRLAATVGRVAASAPATRLLPAPGQWSREAVADAVADLDLTICVIDRGHLAARHWVNQAALATGRPALFGELTLAGALVGPLVLPGESACYMCLRMRHLATLDEFANAFAYERELDARRQPDPDRPIFPGLAEACAGLLIAEAVKLLFGPLRPGSINAVLELEILEPALRRHVLLQRPDCPHCAGLDTAVRVGA